MIRLTPQSSSKFIRDLVIDSQPHHFASHPDNAQHNISTYGPLSHPDGFNLDDLTRSRARSQPMPRHWSPDATAEQLLHGAARDLATLASIVTARTINATGFQPDSDTIKHFSDIANGLRNVTYVLRETKSRRGRPPATAIRTGQTKRRRKKAETSQTESGT